MFGRRVATVGYAALLCPHCRTQYVSLRSLTHAAASAAAGALEVEKRAMRARLAEKEKSVMSKVKVW